MTNHNETDLPVQAIPIPPESQPTEENTMSWEKAEELWEKAEELHALYSKADNRDDIIFDALKQRYPQYSREDFCKALFWVETEHDREFIMNAEQAAFEHADPKGRA